MCIRDRDETGKEIKRAELPVPRRVMSVDTAKTVTELLRETVVSGSSALLLSFPVSSVTAFIREGARYTRCV